MRRGGSTESFDNWLTLTRARGSNQGACPPCSTRGIYKGRLPLFVPSLLVVRRYHLPEPCVTHYARCLDAARLLCQEAHAVSRSGAAARAGALPRLLACRAVG